MKNSDTQQEIILFTNTRFSSFDWQKKNEETNNLTRLEKLEEGCWNGIINELLPELVADHSDSNINLWNIHVGANFFDLEYSSSPKKIEKYGCINPHIFLELQHLN